MYLVKSLLQAFPDFCHSITDRVFLLYDVDNNEPIISENTKKSYEVCSISKIISSMVIIDQCEDLKLSVEVQHNDVICSVYVQEESEYTIYDLLCSALIRSDNNAINCLANHIGIDLFGRLLDEKIKQINMSHTSTNHLPYMGICSNADDLVLMMKYVHDHYPVLVDILSKREASIENLKNHTREFFTSTTEFDKISNVWFGKTGTWYHSANYAGFLRVGGG